MAENTPNGQKTLGEKEKSLMTSIFSFSQIFLKAFFSYGSELLAKLTEFGQNEIEENSLIGECNTIPRACTLYGHLE